MIQKTNARIKAFTIVELLIVIVIIGILAAIVIVGYNAVIGNANDKSVQSDMNQFSDVMNLYSLDNQSFPGNDIVNGITKYNYKPNQGSYAVSPVATYNFDYCYISGSTASYGLVALSKSGNIFYVTNSSNGVKKYSGSWDPDATGIQMCKKIDANFTNSSRGYAANDPITGPWRSWTGIGSHVILSNLITNPSLESNSTNWVGYTGLAAPTRVTSNPYVGGARLSAVGLGTSISPRVYINVPATEGDVFSLTYQTRSDGQTPTSALTAVKVTSGASEVSTFYTNNITWAPDASGWMKVTATFTVPAGGDGIRLTLGVSSASNYSGTLGIDAVMLVKGSKVPVYADGNTAGWTWDGATNSSTSTGPEV